MLCFRLFSENNPAAPLADAVAQLREGQVPKDLYAVEPASFQQIPNAPFAYWVGRRTNQIFEELPPVEDDDRRVRQGLATADDFRFIRATWEAPSISFSLVEERQWFPFVKGGGYAPYYSDVPLRLNWANSGEELKAWIETLPGCTHWSRRIASSEFYFLPGLTWPLRGTRFSAQAVGRGAIFSIAGKFATSSNQEELAYMHGAFNSGIFHALMSTMAGQVGGAQYEAGLISRVPIPSGERSWALLGANGLRAWSNKRRTDTATLTSHAFYAPALAPGRKPTTR